MNRFRVWWCKTFHRFSPYWWGQFDDGSRFYCCRCNRRLFVDATTQTVDAAKEGKT